MTRSIALQEHPNNGDKEPHSIINVCTACRAALAGNHPHNFLGLGALVAHPGRHLHEGISIGVFSALPLIGTVMVLMRPFGRPADVAVAEQPIWHLITVSKFNRITANSRFEMRHRFDLAQPDGFGLANSKASSQFPTDPELARGSGLRIPCRPLLKSGKELMGYQEERGCIRSTWC
jgi:hypothetical protein